MNDLKESLRAVRASFIASLPDRIENMTESLAVVRANSSIEQRQAALAHLMHAAHSIVENAERLDLDGTSRRAQHMIELLRVMPPRPTALERCDVQALACALHRLASTTQAIGAVSTETNCNTTGLKDPLAAAKANFIASLPKRLDSMAADIAILESRASDQECQVAASHLTHSAHSIADIAETLDLTGTGRRARSILLFLRSMPPRRATLEKDEIDALTRAFDRLASEVAKETSSSSGEQN